MRKLNEDEIQELLMQSVEECEQDEELNVQVESFEDAGVLSRDSGFVLTVNGRQFQVTIVRSK